MKIHRDEWINDGIMIADLKYWAHYWIRNRAPYIDPEDAWHHVVKKLTDKNNTDGIEYDNRKPFKAYLKTCLKTAIIDLRKAKGIELKTVVPWKQDVYAVHVDPDELEVYQQRCRDRLAAVKWAMRELSEKQLAVMNAIHFEGYSWREAAHKLGIKLRTLRTHLERANQKLASQLQPYTTGLRAV